MKNAKNKISEKIHNGLSFLSFFFDRIRISIGDSKCPLFEKCPQNDAENNCCVGFRGRTETGGDRALCYSFNKRKIRDVEGNRILGRIFGPIVNLLVSIGGEREDEE